VLYHLAIHVPKPEYEQALIDSMHRFGEAARGQAEAELHFSGGPLDGLRLVGFAIWESMDALTAARPALAAATEGDDFGAWEVQPVQVFLLEEV